MLDFLLLEQMLFSLNYLFHEVFMQNRFVWEVKLETVSELVLEWMQTYSSDKYETRSALLLNLYFSS